jgi:hypothetical protein
MLSMGLLPCPLQAAGGKRLDADWRMGACSTCPEDCQDWAEQLHELAARA